VKKKIAFITGITGMVGSHLLDYLIKNTNWEIHGLVRWRSSLENIEFHIESINKKKRIYLHYGDLRDYQSLIPAMKKSKPDYLFHLAAQSYPLTSFTSPLDTYETNILGTHNILEVVKEHSSNTICHICSSSEIFGKVSKENLPIKEECSFHPASPYAISKIGTDLISKFYFQAYKIKTLTTRMFTHTGPRRGDVFAESSFAKQIAMAENGLTENKIYVGNLNSLRTISDVRDAVKAYFMLVTVKPVFGECYNIGGNQSLTIKEILEFLISISSIKKKLKIIKDSERFRPIDADLQVPDCKKFKSHTGWSPEYNYKKTLNDLLDYWRKKIKKNKNYLVR
tara:strand:+ start:3239 stop:4255 length:1017 start_codon:yes stop_codon:yes gene_type:complete